MTQGQVSKSVSAMFGDERAVAWMEEHMPELRQSASGQRILYMSLAIGFVVGLGAQVGGYALMVSVSGGPIGLFADLLHALGWSLWTGVVVALFVQVIPEVKRRQIKQAVGAFEAYRAEKAERGGNREATAVKGAGAKSTKRAQAHRPDRNRARRGG